MSAGIFEALAATFNLVWLVPFLPLGAAGAIAVRIVFRRDRGDDREPAAVGLACGAAFGALLLLLAFDLAALGRGAPGHLVLGDWFAGGDVRVALSATLDAFSLSIATLVALLGWLVLRFSGAYLHREAGLHRFFFAMSLFLAGMLMIVLAGNAVLAFVGWELAGLASFLLIAYAWERPVATGNALFAFLANRVGDAGFLLGIGLAYLWVGSSEWPALAGGGQLPALTARLLALGFVVAALAKSAQLPFTPWIARALEGPTPSSAIFYGSVMVHAGVYLVIRLEPLLVQSPDLMALIAAAGLATALYAHLCGLVQTDVKSSLIFATATQVGLMFLACGLGGFTLAAWYLALHAAWRAWQFLLAPSALQLLASPTRPAPRWLAGRQWLYTAALQRCWIEPLVDALLARPTLSFGRDLRRLDETVIDRLVGTPRESDPAGEAGMVCGHGLAGRLLTRIAERFERVEQALLLQSGGGAALRLLRRAGEALLIVEALFEQPRYLMLMVMATFVVII